MSVFPHLRIAPKGLSFLKLKLINVKLIESSLIASKPALPRGKEGT
jgi:hypothetical protein